MKKLLLILLLPLSVAAQELEFKRVMKPVACGDFDVVIDSIVNKSGERAEWLAKTTAGYGIALFVNRNTGTWSVVEYTKENACVISIGEGFHEPVRRAPIL